MKKLKLVVNYLGVPNSEIERIYPHILGRNYFLVKSDKNISEINSFIDVVIELNDIKDKLFKLKSPDEDYPFKVAVIMPDSKFKTCLELHNISCYAKSNINNDIAQKNVRNTHNKIVKVKHKRFRRKINK